MNMLSKEEELALHHAAEALEDASVYLQDLGKDGGEDAEKVICKLSSVLDELNNVLGSNHLKGLEEC